MVIAVLGPWEKGTLDRLARKVVHRLSRITAAGLFAEHQYSSVWGEYSHSLQTGPYEEYSSILDDMVTDTCETIAETVPPHEMHLFDRLAAVCGADEGMSGITYLVERLKDEVSSRASLRNLDRYADDYRWFENR